MSVGAESIIAVSGSELDSLADIFKAIGDPGRLKIVHSLLARELCVHELAQTVEMTPSAVSHQLRLLRGLKLVKRRRDGQRIFYSLDDAHISTLLSQALLHVREG